MIRQAHLKLIAGHSVRHGIRGGAGLVSLFLTLVIGLVLASIVISPLDAVDQQIERMDRSETGGHMTEADKAEARQRVNLEVVRIAGKAINWVVEPSSEQLDYLTSQQPAIVSAILVMLFLVTPLFGCLSGFNQTSGDIGSKGLRFLLIRTERQNIFIGRFIGTYLFAALVNLALFLILALYMAAKVKVHPSGDMVLWLGQGYLRVMLFTAPYIAICAWVSCAIDSPFGSLVIALMAAYMFPLIVGRGASLYASVGYLNYLTPWGWKYWLLEPVASAHFLGAAIAMLAFCAGFLFLGLRYFKKRDL
ncbi:MAG: putative rane protein [Deltaproteobacteria bacterium]|nr:putative rane protein [Deltaproteobacteria bacterium]